MLTLGIDRLLQGDTARWRKMRAGLLANPTSQTGDLTPGVDALRAHPDVNLVALFGPEHGVRGDAQAGAHVADERDAATGLPVHSLYGATRKPTPEMLERLDVIFVDLQDAGVRFFTYPYTLAYVMEAAATCNVQVVVLDRPNPIGGDRVEGNVLDMAFRSFVGRYPLALRHGMTLGELATWMNRVGNLGCALDVVDMEGWQRSQWYDETGCFWSQPGPNVPTLDTLTVYPGTCLIEGTNVSEGRGTTRPFEWIGAPWINPRALLWAMRDHALPGTAFRQIAFTPTFSKYQGQPCQGIQIYVTDRERFAPVQVGLTLIRTIRALHPAHFRWIHERPDEPLFFDLLMGTDRVRRRIEDGVPTDTLCRDFQAQREAFMRQRMEHLRYD